MRRAVIAVFWIVASCGALASAACGSRTGFGLDFASVDDRDAIALVNTEDGGGVPAIDASIAPQAKLSLCGDTTGLAPTAWPMVGGCPARRGVSAYEVTLEPHKRWSVPQPAEVESTYGYGGYPVLGAGDVIYVGLRDGRFYALSPTDGSTLWIFDVGNTNPFPAIARDGTIYVAGEGGNLSALTPAGKLVWSVAGPTGITSPVVDKDGVIYMGTGNGIAAYFSDGTTKWRALPGNACDGTPAIDDDANDPKLYIACSFGIDAIRTSDGNVVWASGDGFGRASPVIGRDGVVFRTIVDDEFSPAGSAGIYALSPNDGGPRSWTPLASSGGYSREPAIAADGTIWIEDGQGDGGPVVARLPKDGGVTTHWPSYTTAPLLIDAAGRIISTNSFSVEVHTRSGALVWSYDLGESVVGEMALGTDGTLYIPGYYHFYAIGPKH